MRDLMLSGRMSHSEDDSWLQTHLQLLEAAAKWLPESCVKEVEVVRKRRPREEKPGMRESSEVEMKLMQETKRLTPPVKTKRKNLFLPAGLLLLLQRVAQNLSILWAPHRRCFGNVRFRLCFHFHQVTDLTSSTQDFLVEMVLIKMRSNVHSKYLLSFLWMDRYEEIWTI